MMGFACVLFAYLIKKDRGMKMKESDIIAEEGSFWVCRNKKLSYDVMISGFTYSTVISSFPYNDDGLSLAIAYMKYKAKRELDLLE